MSKKFDTEATFEKLPTRKKLRRSRRGNNKSIPKRKTRRQSL